MSSCQAIELDHLGSPLSSIRGVAELLHQRPSAVYVVPGEPIPAPRQTARDRWGSNKRPAVQRYHDWRDAARTFIPHPPAAKDIDMLAIVCAWQPPSSWSQRKRGRSLGERKRTKPDWDNVAKTVCDALWPQDSPLGDALVLRRFAEQASVVLYLWLREEGGK